MMYTGVPQIELGTLLLGKGHLRLVSLLSLGKLTSRLPLWDRRERGITMARPEREHCDELNSLRDKYPAWHIWMSQARRLWATRKGRISPNWNRDSRWSMTIDADTSEDLGKQPEQQSLLG
jgi:hypothetical protein